MTLAESALSAPRRCGTVAIVGRPNVGKSTLLNALVGQKISITSRKAQTTRHRIVGVRTRGAAQFAFVDTPGFQARHTQALNRNLNRAVRSSLADVDLVLLVVEAGRFGNEDRRVVDLLPAGMPTILVANKLDTVSRRADLLPWLQALPQQHDFAEYVPMSADRSADVERLLDIIEPYLPARPWLHDADALTDRNERFLAAEIVREKLFRLTGDELPYTSTVVVDRFEEWRSTATTRAERAEVAARDLHIAATIVVEREAHKGIVIGHGGERLKRIGTEARHELQRLLDARVHLALWVQMRSGWADDEQHLRSYGIE
ncbi:MAG TPA: GTPase Era [Burkholderiaceae bacterium]|nr:GTPase Era [Burkholderiaceae bacterium]